MIYQEALQKGIRFAILISLLATFYTPSRARTELPLAMQAGKALLGPLDRLGGTATEISLLEDDYSAVAIGLDLIIVDIIDASHPIQVGRLEFANPIVDLFTFGGYAYVLTGPKVHLVDLTNPHQPVDRGNFSEYANDLDGEADYLFLVADGNVNIYSLSNPASPQLVGVFTPEEFGACGEYFDHYRSVQVVSSFPYLYVHAREPCWDGIFYTSEQDYIVDISTPANPVERTHVNFTVQEVATAQDYMYFVPEWSDPQGVKVVARQNRDTLEVAATIPSPGVQGIAVHGKFLYVLDNTLGLRIFDVSDPLAAVEVGLDPALAGARELVVPDRLAYIAAGSLGLVVLDVRNPESLAWIGNHHTIGIANEVTAAGNYAYVSSDRLDIVNISDPAHLSVVGEYPRTGSAFIAGNVLYMASGVDGLAAIDISNPAAPTELDRIDTPGEANAVAVEGSYAYVADGSGGLRVVDVSDPSNLKEVGSLASPAPLFSVAISQGYAYLGSNNFSVADLSDPTSPAIVFKSEDLDYPAFHLAVYGEYVYITQEIDDCGCVGHSCEDWASLVVFEKSASSGWDILSAHSLTCPIGDLEIAGDRVYVTSAQMDPFSPEIIVFDAANPTETEPIYTYHGSAWSLAVLDELVIVADRERGLYTLKWGTPIETFLPAVFRE